MTLDAFTEAVRADLEGRGWAGRSLGGGRLTVTSADREAALLLHRPWMQGRATGDWAAAIASVAAGLVPRGQPPAEALLPLLREDAGVTAALAQGGAAPPVFAAPGGLWWMAAWDRGAQWQLCDRLSLDLLGLDDAATARRCLTNLEGLPRTVEPLAGPWLRLSAPGGLGAALLLIAERWQAEVASGPLLAVAPAQDLLLVASAADPDAPAELAALERRWSGRLRGALPWIVHRLNGGG